MVYSPATPATSQPLSREANDEAWLTTNMSWFALSKGFRSDVTSTGGSSSGKQASCRPAALPLMIRRYLKDAGWPVVVNLVLAAVVGVSYFINFGMRSSFVPSLVRADEAVNHGLVRLVHVAAMLALPASWISRLITRVVAARDAAVTGSAHLIGASNRRRCCRPGTKGRLFWFLVPDLLFIVVLIFTASYLKPLSPYRSDGRCGKQYPAVPLGASTTTMALAEGAWCPPATPCCSRHGWCGLLSRDFCTCPGCKDFTGKWDPTGSFVALELVVAVNGMVLIHALEGCTRCRKSNGNRVALCCGLVDKKVKVDADQEEALFGLNRGGLYHFKPVASV